MKKKSFIQNLLIFILSGTVSLQAYAQPVQVQCIGQNPGCAGGNDGKVTATAFWGAGGPYTYAWSTGVTTISSNSVSITGLNQGSYSCIVKDASGTTGSGSTISDPPVITADPLTSTPATCGQNNGSASISNVQGGVPFSAGAPYHYLWNDPAGQTTPTATGLGTGPYSCTVTDQTCSKPFGPVTVNPGGSTVSANIQSPHTDVLCRGNNTGSATVLAAGGGGNYTYAWSPSGGGLATASNLTAGPYTVLVTDQNNCTATDNVVITEPGSALTIMSATSVHDVYCSGGSTGAATIPTPAGGTGSYTYLWTGSNEATQNANALPSGNWHVTVTDQNGCSKTSNDVSIGQPQPISATATPHDATCGAANGSADANPTGGTPPYTYSWNDPLSQVTQTAAGLTPATYNVQVTDSHNCPAAGASATVGNSGNLSATIQFPHTDVLCNSGNNGSATVIPSGGTGNYTYLWSPFGGNAATANFLTAGNYNVTVSEGTCSTNTGVTISEPGPITITNISTTPATCGSNNGTATVNGTSGGSGSYNYSWFPSGGNAAAANGLSATNYTVTITDLNSCSDFFTTSINNTGGPTVSLASAPVNVSCNGGNDGSAAVSASGGGGGPYTYSWSPSGGTNAAANNLSAGNYIVSVKNSANCVTSQSVLITEPPAISATITSTPAGCSLSNGSASVSASGGTGALAYSWSNGQTTAGIAGLTAGNYTVTIKDTKNCTKVFTTTVGSSGGATITVTSQGNVSCNGGNDGFANVTAAGGGGAPYTYTWAPSGGTNASASNLAAGIYTVTVSKSSCSATQTIAITQPLPVNANTGNAISICTGSSSTITANGFGGTAGYNYNWAGTNLSCNACQTPIASPTSATIYTVTVTDSKSCTGIGTLTVTLKSPPVITAGNDATICSNSFTQLNAGGGVSYTWSPSSGLTCTSCANPVASLATAGSYSYAVTGTDAIGCTNTDQVVVTVTSAVAPTVNISSSSPSTICSGTAITLTANTNGTAYLWSNNATTSSITVAPSASATYSVVVSNASGCNAFASKIITVLSTPIVTINGPGAICNSGSVTLTGTGIGNYMWSTGAITSAIIVSPTLTTVYSLTVSAGSCSGIKTHTVTVATNPVISITSTYTTVCIGMGVTSLTATSAGATSYAWSPGGQTTASVRASPNATTIYTVTITNAGGCTAKSTITVNVSGTSGFNVPAVNPSTANICIGDPIPTFTATPQPAGTGIYWTDNFDSFFTQSITFQPQNLAAGTYTFYCGQGNNVSCLSNPATVIVTVNSFPTAAAGKDVTICAGHTASLHASGGGTYSWSPATGLNNPFISNPQASPVSSTPYEVLVSANGCKDKDSVTVFVVLNDTCGVDIYNLISPNGDGKNDTWWIDGINSFSGNSVSIYNRWGGKVWEGRNYDNDRVVWTGENQNGTPLPDGTYYYVLELGDKVFSGFVELAR